MDFAWTEERVDQLKQLWADGRSAAQIAAEFGGLSRSAVLGKIHRLGLHRAPKPRARPWIESGISEHTYYRRHRKSNSRPSLSQPEAFKLDVVQFMAAIAEPEAGKVTLLDLESHHCRFPVSGEGLATLFCGDDRLEPHSYCARHCAVAFRIARPHADHHNKRWRAHAA